MVKAQVLQINWHDRKAIYSIHIQPPQPEENKVRMASAGGDGTVRMWQVLSPDRVHFLSSLSRHDRPVNCVRFSPSGDTLASAGDGGTLIIWKKGISSLQGNLLSQEENEEEWMVLGQLRVGDGTTDVYEIAWSPDGLFVALATTDNSICLISVQLPLKLIKIVKDHQHFCQGVAWDPFGQILATASCDRSFKVLIACPVELSSKSKGFPKLYTSSLGKIKGGEDETLISFFRRLGFSNDGSFLFLPSFVQQGAKGIGIVNRNALHTNTVSDFIPLPPNSKPVIAIRPHPFLFTSDNSLGYRSVFAAITLDTVFLFDTRQYPTALFTITGLHYSALTDASWSADGLMLFVSSTDGFCSVLCWEMTDFCSEPLDPIEQNDIISSRLECSRAAWSKRKVTTKRRRDDTSASIHAINNADEGQKENLPPTSDILMSDLQIE